MTPEEETSEFEFLPRVVLRDPTSVYHAEGYYVVGHWQEPYVSKCGTRWYYEDDVCEEEDAIVLEKRPCMRCFPNRYIHIERHFTRKRNVETGSHRLEWI